MVGVENGYETCRETVPVEVRVEMSREVLATVLYESSLSAADLAEFGDVEIYEFVVNALVFNGRMSLNRQADRVFAAWRAGTLDAADAAWWHLCSCRIDAVFFGTSGVGAVRAEAFAAVAR